jgi:S-(hydroxymethyl)glutathione dehydrogenase/alcohol dehydrogenase
MIHCKAAVTNGNGQFSIREISVGAPKGDEVLVKIMAAGVCHTDWDALSWGKTLILGHEGAGIVVKTGENVTDFAVGDRVMLNWAIPCYQCFQCQLGNQHLCESNSAVAAGNKRSGGHANFESTTCEGKPIERSFSLGTMAEYTIVRAAACVKIKVKMPFASAAIVGCGVMTGYGSVVHAAQVKAGSSVVVLGTGGVGLNVIQASRISGAQKIISVDINPKRLEMAATYGATHLLLADKKDIGLLQMAQKVKEMTQGRGADYAFECTAVPALGAAPLAMIRHGGTAVQVSGIEQEIKLDMNLFEWDKIYINPLYGKTKPQIDFPILQQLYHSGVFKLDELITSTYPLEKLGEAFHDMHSGKNAKGVIAFTADE